MSGWILVPQSVESCTTIKAVRVILRACGWPKRSATCRPLCSGISRPTKGAFARASDTLSRL
jgi:hypothetical protein